MSDTDTRVQEAYEHMEDSQEHDYQRVLYDDGQGSPRWVDGYTADAKVAGEAALKVVNEEGSWTVPWGRVIHVRAGGVKDE